MAGTFKPNPGDVRQDVFECVQSHPLEGPTLVATQQQRFAAKCSIALDCGRHFTSNDDAVAHLSESALRGKSDEHLACLLASTAGILPPGQTAASESSAMVRAPRPFGEAGQLQVLVHALPKRGAHKWVLSKRKEEKSSGNPLRYAVAGVHERDGDRPGRRAGDVVSGAEAENHSAAKRLT